MSRQLALITLFAVICTGCITEEEGSEYICLDGSIVTDTADCPDTTSTMGEKTTTSEPYVEPAVDWSKHLLTTTTTQPWVEPPINWSEKLLTTTTTILKTTTTFLVIPEPRTPTTTLYMFPDKRGRHVATTTTIDMKKFYDDLYEDKDGDGWTDDPDQGMYSPSSTSYADGGMYYPSSTI
ncbi:hypothetical protein ACFLRF_01545 [Candidatus Altiarchaeota archaeon]